MEHVAQVNATGGRTGRVWTESGSIDATVVPPGATTPGVTPEELLAAAWGACYGSAYAFEARAAGISPTPQFAIEVVLDVDEGVYTVSRATLAVPAGDDNQEVVREVAQRAHVRCPISKVLAGGVSAVEVRLAPDS
jgi:osmotically inducible protein OsmC